MIKIGCDEIYIELRGFSGIQLVTNIDGKSTRYAFNDQDIDGLFYMLHEDRKKRMLKEM